MEQLKISPDDFTQLINLFNQNYRGEQESACWILEERDPKAKYKKCILRNYGKSLLLNTDNDEIHWRRILAGQTKDIHRKCDYVLLSLINETLYVFFIEMKGDQLTTARKQVNNTYFYFLYLMQLILHNTSISQSTSINYKGIILCSKSKSSIKARKFQPIPDPKTNLKFFVLGQFDELDFNGLDLDS
ncbi:MAG: hypothetical protein DCF12_06845 [Snowella sp.]|jgi:hypothetical protein|nr:MAG: hypothetical protein DCF12_06845 [Snowella sp.]